MKTIFISEYGMSEYIAGILQGMENGWIVQKYENKLEALNAALNSTTYPLANTQVFNLEYANPDAPTAEELRKTINSIKKLRAPCSWVLRPLPSTPWALQAFRMSPG